MDQNKHHFKNISMSLTLSVASKTFLAGEYLALFGGGALLLATEPRFKLIAKNSQNLQNLQNSSDKINSLNIKEINPFHPLSPAGQFWQKHEIFFSNFKIHFVDPFEGSGGWGASSAEFLLLYALWTWGQGAEIEKKEKDFFDALILNMTPKEQVGKFYISKIKDQFENLKKNPLPLILLYQKFSQKTVPPSGADLVGQLNGGLTYYEKNKSQIKSFQWPFPHLGLALVATGNKIKTHEHLDGVDLKSLPEEKMNLIMAETLKGLEQKNEHLFIKGLRDFSALLEQEGLLAPETKKLLANWNQQENILIKKGCGALGSDVIAFVYKKTMEAKSQLDPFLMELKKCNCKIVATEEDLSEGLLFELRKDLL